MPPLSLDQRNRRDLVVRCILEAAGLTVGGREVGTNGGALVNGWQRVTGNSTGDAWCVSWAVAVIVAMLRALFGDRVRFPLPLSGSCDAMLIRARALGIAHELHGGVEPEPGDLVLRLASDTDATHCMLAGADLAGPTWRTIEGNTNAAGGREGEGVYAKVHGGPTDGTRYVAVRWLDALTLPPLFG